MKFSSAEILFTVVSVLAMGVFMPSAATDDTPVPAVSQSLEERPSIQVASADRLSLRFQGQADLTGEYRVSPDGTLSVPVIGRMNIADMSLAQLEQELTRRVTEFTSRVTYVTAEIISYRPLFVTGFVSKPGAVEWHPGITVLQAEALVGGLYRAPEETNRNETVSGVEALRILRTGHEEQKLLLASLARLKAEKAGSAQVEIPPALVGLVGEQEARSLIEGQQSYLNNRRTGLERRKAALERSADLADDELDALQEQAARVSEQLQMRRDMHEKLAGLLQKGLVPRERALESEIKIAELEEKATNVAVARARVQSTAAMLKQEAVALEEDRAAGIDAEIARLEGELAKAGIDVEAATIAYDRLAAETARVAATPLRRMVIEYMIVRRNETGEQRAPAQASSYLLPGDVLLVSQEWEQAANQTPEALSGGETGRTGNAQ
jgi:protein involved in polysaccharide export with SLBB domain